MKKAFTLAEVLVTLGIIGVVVALTLPAVIANYRKKEYVSILKQSYSVLGQALVKNQADYGDFSEWGLGGIYGQNSSTVDASKVIPMFMDSYLKPNLNIVQDYGWKTREKIGSDGPYRPSTHTITGGNLGYWFVLSNGALVKATIGDGCVQTDKDGNCIAREYRNIIFMIDVNGFKNPNVIGKDVFLMALELKTNIFTMHRYSTHVSRNNALKSCQSDEDSQTCGNLIMMDGWEIKKDYPWL